MRSFSIGRWPQDCPWRFRALSFIEVSRAACDHFNGRGNDTTTAQAFARLHDWPPVTFVLRGAIEPRRLDVCGGSGLMAGMCRIAGYLGQGATLNCLVDGPPHGLHRQSYAARELETSVVSADGWGAAWYLPGDEEPCVYRSTLPIWGDANRRDQGRAAASQCLMAAVRSATDPLGIAVHNTQPFKFQSLCFVHNGYIEQFKPRLRRSLTEHLSGEVYQVLMGDTDSEYLFALLCEYWQRGAALPRGERLLAAVRQALGVVLDAARAHSLKALLTLQVSDGRHLIAARAALNARSPTLYSNQSADGELWLASEPLDDRPGWTELAEGSLVFARVGEPLEYLPISTASNHR